MKPPLKDIQQRFNQASQTYDGVAIVQQYAAHFLVDRMLIDNHFEPKTIFDVGTGTGYVAYLLSLLFKEAHFYLNDIADKMLNVCQNKLASLSHVHYLLGDVRTVKQASYDLVISNLAIQWIDDLTTIIPFLNHQTTHTFAFSALLNGTFNEWKQILSLYQPFEILDYPTLDQLLQVCQSNKRRNQIFEYACMDIPLSFPSAMAFMRYLKLLGASAAARSAHSHHLKKLIQCHSNSLTVTYKIFFGIFRHIK